MHLPFKRHVFGGGCNGLFLIALLFLPVQNFSNAQQLTAHTVSFNTSYNDAVSLAVRQLYYYRGMNETIKAPRCEHFKAHSHCAKMCVLIEHLQRAMEPSDNVLFKYATYFVNACDWSLFYQEKPNLRKRFAVPLAVAGNVQGDGYEDSLRLAFLQRSEDLFFPKKSVFTCQKFSFIKKSWAVHCGSLCEIFVKLDSFSLFPRVAPFCLSDNANVTDGNAFISDTLRALIASNPLPPFVSYEQFMWSLFKYRVQSLLLTPSLGNGKGFLKQFYALLKTEFPTTQSADCAVQKLSGKNLG